MSSFAARAHTFDADDWQLVNSTTPYGASKSQMDLIRAELSRRAGPSAQVRHFAVHPGAVDSSISAALDSGLLTYVKIFTFYLVRFILCLLYQMSVRLGFQPKPGFSCRLGGLAILHYNISPWNGAAAAVYICLAPLAFIPVLLSAAGVPVMPGKVQKGGALPVCLHSVTDRRGLNSVTSTPFHAWPEYKEEASRLVGRCERLLYQSYVTAGGKLQQE